MALSVDRCFEILRDVADPEIPTLSVVDLGIVRNVQVEGSTVRVTITPTYSGCPAMKLIADNLSAAIRATGEVSEVIIETVLSPAWTTDWITEEGRQQLKANAITPPLCRADEKLVYLPTPRQPIPCPFCESEQTSLRSEFGATACKALYFCNSCQQPFEYFKPF